MSPLQMTFRGTPALRHVRECGKISFEEPPEQMLLCWASVLVHTPQNYEGFCHLGATQSEGTKPGLHHGRSHHKPGLSVEASGSVLHK